MAHQVGSTRYRFLMLVGLMTSVISTVAIQGTAAQRDKDKGESNIPQVAFIDQEISNQWKEYEISPSAPATDGEWCRRVYLDVLGRIPSVEELGDYTSSRDSNKKAKLVSKLLYDEAYTEEYARNWTTIWTNVLIGRSGGSERNSLTDRAGMQKYLRDSFARNKPYDRMVLELVTAKGSNRPGSEDFNGAVNFLAMKVNDEKGTLATASTAKIFLGLQVQCTQCHNHPFNEWKQQKFWEFNAFFRQSRALRRYEPGTRNVIGSELVNEDFSGEGNNVAEAEIYYELRNGLLKVAYPVFVDGTPIDRSGYVQEVDRRTELGKLMMKSEYMDKMVVNRYWAHFMGYGFTKPVDDMGPHNPPTHPALIDYLGQEIRKNSYNLKDLIRWITLSRPYGLSSKINKSNAKDDPLLGELPKFSHFYLRQMRAEELYESLMVATNAAETGGGSYADREKVKAQWLSQFVMAFGNDEGGETTTFNGTIPQALMMFNGALIKRATKSDRGSFLADIANNKALNPKQKIDYLFKSGLGRKPSLTEMTFANKLLAARMNDQTKGGNKKIDMNKAGIAALQDIWWAVLNSNEFIINH